MDKEIEDTDRAVKEFLRSWQLASMQLHPENLTTLQKLPEGSKGRSGCLCQIWEKRQNQARRMTVQPF